MNIVWLRRGRRSIHHLTQQPAWQSMRVRRLLVASMLALIACGAAPVFAQSQSAIKPLTIVVPYSAGGPTDRIAKALVAELGAVLGEPVQLRYEAGAGGTLGPARMIAEGDTSGRTLLLHHLGMATAPTLYRRLGYQPLRDFAPIGRIADAPMILLGRTDLLPAGISIASHIRANQNSLMLAYAGAGSASQMCSLLLEAALKVKLMWIPYKGTGPALKDLAARRVDLLCDQTTQALEAVSSGSAAGYAVTTPGRLSLSLAIPTTTEVGMPDMQISIWHGLYANAGTNPQTIDRLSRALQQAVGSSGFREAMTALGLVPASASQATPDSLRKLLESETLRWQVVIRAAGQYAD